MPERTVPRSTRWPWSRGGLLGGVAALSPLVWVTVINSCGGQSPPPHQEVTGVELVRGFNFEGWWPLVLTVTVAATLLTPWLARWLAPALRTVVHLIGAAASGLMAYVAWLGIFWGLFTIHVVRLAGWVVTTLFILILGDSLLRVGLSAQEWWRGRRDKAAP